MNSIRIGIISADINTPKFNYGAILHTWAFEEFLKKNGYNCYENINYFPEEVVNQHRLLPLLDFFTRTHRRLSLMYMRHYFQYLKKYKKIKHFCDRKMVNSRRKYTYKNISNSVLNYDLLIAEDDVIWAPHFLCKSEVVDKTFFLAHDNMSNIRKISYAPSMSDCHFDKNDIPLLKKYLTQFDRISVRETYAADYIKHNMDLDAISVLDAVFLLDTADYNQIISGRFENMKPYLLLYLPAEDNDELRKKASFYAEKYRLKIIEVSNRIKSFGNVYGDCGVEDFLSAIKYATVIFTNSFHALCFALIFKKNFYVFSRLLNGKNIDLCQSLNIMDRYSPKEVSDKPIKYSEVSVLIEKRKKLSREWLLKSISGDY